jgi:hypothetical protein
MNPARISPQEWRRVSLFAALAIALVMLPYAAGWAAQTADARFSGAVIAADDIHSYLGKMRLGARGIWDFTLFYTPEEHAAVPGVFLPYIAAGQLVGLLIAQDDPALTPALIAVFHLMRVTFTLLLVAALYRFIAHFLSSPAQRMTALILSIVGGGFGWLLLLLPGGGDWLGSLPPDVFIPEGFGFLIALALPHLALARAALLLGFLALFHAVHRASAVYALLAGLCWMLVGVIVPFYLAVIYCLLAAWVIVLALRMGVRAPALHRVLILGGAAAALTLPLFGYYALAFAANPAFAAWSAQNLLPAPHPLQYLVAYSLFLIPGVPALRWAWRRGRARGETLLLIAWVIAAFVLVYLPINVQRRMSEAVIVPLAILASHGLAVWLRARIPTRRRTRVRAGFLALASLTSLVLLLLTTLGALSRSAPVHIAQAQIDALNWLNRSAPPDARILAAMPTGNLIPAYTHLRPYVGHGPETLNALDKQAETERYYADSLSAAERAALYRSVGIRYVYYGAAERALALDVERRQWAQGLRLVYDAGGVEIYAVPPG